MAEVPSFVGFGPEAMPFLAGLAVDNSKMYFDHADRPTSSRCSPRSGPSSSPWGSSCRIGSAPASRSSRRSADRCSASTATFDTPKGQDAVPHLPRRGVFREGASPRASRDSSCASRPARSSSVPVCSGSPTIGSTGGGSGPRRRRRVRTRRPDRQRQEGPARWTLSEPTRKTVPRGLPADHPLGRPVATGRLPSERDDAHAGVGHVDPIRHLGRRPSREAGRPAPMARSRLGD